MPKYVRDPKSGRLLEKIDHPRPIYRNGQYIGARSIYLEVGDIFYYANLAKSNQVADWQWVVKRNTPKGRGFVVMEYTRRTPEPESKGSRFGPIYRHPWVLAKHNKPKK